MINLMSLDADKQNLADRLDRHQKLSQFSIDFSKRPQILSAEAAMGCCITELNYIANCLADIFTYECEWLYQRDRNYLLALENAEECFTPGIHCRRQLAIE